MVTKSNICSAVEGAQLYITTRQFHVQPPKKIKPLNKVVYPFRLGINGTAKIVTAYEAPETQCVYSNSLVVAGDEIQGGSVDGWSTKILGKRTVTSLTGTHSGTTLSVHGQCFAHVQSGHRHHQQSAAVQIRHPDITLIENDKRLE